MEKEKLETFRTYSLFNYGFPSDLPFSFELY